MITVHEALKRVAATMIQEAAQGRALNAELMKANGIDIDAYPVFSREAEMAQLTESLNKLRIELEAWLREPRDKLNA